MKTVGNMNTETISSFMASLRSEQDDCPSCANKKHTRECDFGDFVAVDTLTPLYVDPSFDHDQFEDTYVGFLRERSERTNFLDCLCYVLTSDVFYVQLETSEIDTMQLVEKCTSEAETDIHVTRFFQENKTFNDTSDPEHEIKLGKSLRALELFVRVKNGDIGSYESDQLSIRQKTVASAMVKAINNRLQGVDNVEPVDNIQPAEPAEPAEPYEPKTSWLPGNGWP